MLDFQTPVSVRADASASDSVVFQLDGVTIRVENVAPYTVAGNDGDTYYPWTPSAGAHLLMVTPYSGPNGSGVAGTSKAVNFTVTGPSVQALHVVDAANGDEIAGLIDGAIVDLKTPLSVRADASAGSVVFKLDGVTVQTENTAPYSVAGNNGDVYNPWKPALGSHKLEVIPYGSGNGRGVQGDSITVSFTVVNTGSP